MPTQTVNIDTAAPLNITGIYTGNSFELAFKNYADSTLTSPKDYVGTFTMLLSKEPSMVRVFLQIPQGANLSVTGNTLTFKMNKTQNPFEHTKYYFQIINDVDSSHSYVAFKGVIYVNSSR